MKYILIAWLLIPGEHVTLVGHYPKEFATYLGCAAFRDEIWFKGKRELAQQKPKPRVGIVCIDKKTIAGDLPPALNEIELRKALHHGAD